MRTGDVIGVVLDLEEGSLSFSKNGISLGVAFSSGLTGKELYASVSLYDVGDRVTFRDDASEGSSIDNTPLSQFQLHPDSPLRYHRTAPILSCPSNVRLVDLEQILLGHSLPKPPPPGVSTTAQSTTITTSTNSTPTPNSTTTTPTPTTPTPSSTTTTSDSNNNSVVPSSPQPSTKNSKSPKTVIQFYWGSNSQKPLEKTLSLSQLYHRMKCESEIIDLYYETENGDGIGVELTAAVPPRSTLIFHLFAQKKGLNRLVSILYWRLKASIINAKPRRSLSRASSVMTNNASSSNSLQTSTQLNINGQNSNINNLGNNMMGNNSNNQHESLGSNNNQSNMNARLKDWNKVLRWLTELSSFLLVPGFGELFVENDECTEVLFEIMKTSAELLVADESTSVRLLSFFAQSLVPSLTPSGLSMKAWDPFGELYETLQMSFVAQNNIISRSISLQCGSIQFLLSSLSLVESVEHKQPNLFKGYDIHLSMDNVKQGGISTSAKKEDPSQTSSKQPNTTSSVSQPQTPNLSASGSGPISIQSLTGNPLTVNAPISASTLSSLASGAGKWAKGTGYGTAQDNASQWNQTEYLKLQDQRAQKSTALLQSLILFLSFNLSGKKKKRRF